jgi:hypothetical protein
MRATSKLSRGHEIAIGKLYDTTVVEKVGIDPIITARTLWLETHPSLWPKDDAQIGSLQG